MLPPWRGRLVRDIIRRDVLDLIDRVVDGGKPIAANRTLAAIRKMFNWAVARDIIAASPSAGVKFPTAERSRDRVLDRSGAARGMASGRQDRRHLRGSGPVAHPNRPATGRSAGMRWSEIDLEGCRWTLAPERMKNDRPRKSPW